MINIDYFGAEKKQNNTKTKHGIWTMHINQINNSFCTFNLSVMIT